MTTAIAEFKCHNAKCRNYGVFVYVSSNRLDGNVGYRPPCSDCGVKMWHVRKIWRDDFSPSLRAELEKVGQ